MKSGAPPPFFASDVSLAERTTLGVGGKARHLADARSIDEAVSALAWAHEQSLPVFVLGGGSNVLVSDRGFDGVVLRFVGAGRERVGDRLRVEAGHDWEELVRFSVEEGMAGIECLSGIPGLVGATPIQNVGAYGQEVSETITDVDIVDRTSGERRTIDAAGCAFGYRSSVFKGPLRDRALVVSVTFTLRPGGPPSTRYAELERHLERAGLRAPSLREVRTAIVELRRAKSMVLDPADENRRSAGSFFMNPILDRTEADRVRERVADRGVVKPGESMPAYPSGPDQTKLSAAWLIERAGFSKGTSRGRVGISTRHSLAIVNRGGATSAELLAFAREVRDGVLEAFGVRLCPEPELIGFTPEELGDLTGAMLTGAMLTGVMP